MNDELKERLARALAKFSWSVETPDFEVYFAGTRAAWIEQAEDILSELGAAGYAVVPRVPTDAMLKAGLAKAGAASLPDDVWPPMIAAAEQE